MIVGTAGHIDHGKTSLVRALTGVDTDRLPEEKARGISIELGYAYLDLPPAPGAADTPAPRRRIGFVDVPGHERLVRTMLAGATGIDFGLLVVAADDGVMPQTREHLAVLALLGLAEGAVALTKIDRVDADRVAAVRAEVAALLAGTPLDGAPVVPVSSTTGEGMAALRTLLFDAAQATDDRTPPAERETPTGDETPPAATAPPASVGQPGFRLAVDRAFTLAGLGTVVTGSVRAGWVAVGDELIVAPTEGRERRARVRSLHAADRPAARAGAGERCALALAGLERDEVGRGCWLVAPAIGLATTRLDVRLRVWHEEARALRSGTIVHLHVGTADVLASVAVLRVDPAGAATVDPELPNVSPAEAIPPGCGGWVQLVTREPLAAWHGDRIVLRDASARRTIAGGEVLDPFAPARLRRSPQRLAELAAAEAAAPAERLARRIAAAPLGVSVDRWALGEGRVLASASSGGGDAPVVERWRIDASAGAAIERRALAALGDFHERHPELPGLDTAALRRIAAPRLAEPLWRATLATLQARGAIALQAAFACLAEHQQRMSAGDAALLARVEPRIAAAGKEGAWVRDLARALGSDEAQVRTGLARLARHGTLHQVVKDLYWTSTVLGELAGTARRLAAAADGAVTAARFRDATGLGRKRAIQLLEYFDRIGLLRRVGEEHRLRGDSRLFDPAPDERA